MCEYFRGFRALIEFTKAQELLEIVKELSNVRVF